MNVACPYCKAVLTPKNLKPGRYSPNCPKCGKQFSLTVSQNGDEEMSVAVQMVVQKPAPAPLPDTKQVPMVRLPRGAAKDEGAKPQADEKELADTEEHDISPTVADPDAPTSHHLPKTTRMPIFRKPPKVLPEESDETHAE